MEKSKAAAAPVPRCSSLRHRWVLGFVPKPSRATRAQGAASTGAERAVWYVSTGAQLQRSHRVAQQVFGQSLVIGLLCLGLAAPAEGRIGGEASPAARLTTAPAMDGTRLARRRKARTRRSRASRRSRSQAVEPAAPAEPPAAQSTAAAPETSGALRRGARVEFDGRLVQGQTAKSGAIYLFARKRSELRSMVTERTSYRREILRTIYPNDEYEGARK